MHLHANDSHDLHVARIFPQLLSHVFIASFDDLSVNLYQSYNPLSEHFDLRNKT